MTDPGRHLNASASADTVRVSLHTGPVAPSAPVYPRTPIHWHDGGEVTVTGALVYDLDPDIPWNEGEEPMTEPTNLSRLLAKARRDRELLARLSAGWLSFGWHANYSPVPELEFSEETDTDGLPLWERAVGAFPS